MGDNLLVQASERDAHGYIDYRVVWGTQEPQWWSVIWMAVSCCCGLKGKTLPVHLPEPEPRVRH